MPLAIQSEYQINSNDFQIIASKIEDYFGFHFEAEKKDDLLRILRNAFKKSEFDNWLHFLDNLITKKFDEKTIIFIAKHLTIGETYFFRENSLLENFFDVIIPKLIKKGKTNLNIWSASCSTGEEPYTILLMIKEQYPDLFDNINIYATDINKNFLKIAEKGVYRNWSFRNTTQVMRDKYFKNSGEGNFELIDKIKNKVKFKYFNLTSDFGGFFSPEIGFDLILFRNTMIYFSESINNRILSNLSNLLNEGGYLIAGIAETVLVKIDKLRPIKFDHTRIFKKDSNYINSVIQHSPNTPKKKRTPARSRKFPKPEIKLHSSRNIKSQYEDLSSIIKKSTKIFSAEEMNNLFENGDYDKFIEYYDATIKVQNNNINKDLLNEMNLLYCKSYANKGSASEAIKNCNDFLRINQLDSRLHELAAQLYTELGDYTNAKNHLDKAIFIDYESPLLFFFRATVNFKLNNVDIANKDLKHVIRMLDKHDNNEILEKADGLTAGRLKNIAGSLLKI